jgi:hypothetical protein
VIGQIPPARCRRGKGRSLGSPPHSSMAEYGDSVCIRRSAGPQTTGAALGQATDIGAAATMLSVVRRASLGWREPLGKVARICGDTSPSNARPANDLRAAAPCRVYAGEQLAPLGQPRLSGWTLEPMTQHSRLDHPRRQMPEDPGPTSKGDVSRAHAPRPRRSVRS